LRQPHHLRKHVDELLPGIIAEIVDVVSEVDGSDEIQGVSVVDVELASSLPIKISLAADA